MTWRALSILQPWAWLILRPDLTDPAVRFTERAAGRIKDVENRSWSTDVRGWVLVQASAGKLAKWDWTAAAMFAAKRHIELPLQGAFPRSAYVGAMRIDGCEQFVASRWFTSEGWGFRIGASVPFAEPVAGKGTLGFYDPFRDAEPGWARDLRRQLAAQLTAAGLAREFGLTS